MEYQQEMERQRQMIEARLGQAFPGQGLGQAMAYSLMAGGKRIRPILTLEFCRAAGGDPQQALDAACGVEMLHTYSLIHDDLPALDNDEYRRGKKTTHVVFGESAAILAGDALLNYAYETAFRAFDLAKGEKELRRTARALEILGEKTGIKGMLGGQGADVENDGKPLSKDMLDFIYENKTSALIEASLMIGAVLAGTEDMVKIEKIGSCIGLAFQIQDDILDVTSSREELGKPVGSDAKNNKTTYVTLEGIEKAGEEVKRRTEMAIELLDDLPGEKEFLKELFLSLCTRRK